MTYIWLIAALLFIFIIWSILEQRLLVSSSHIIHTDKLGNDIQDLSFIILADLHNHSLDKDNKRLINRIRDYKPDYLIIAGDMITKRRPCYPSKAYNLIKELAEQYPIYYGLGNHEQYFENLAQPLNSASGNEETDRKNNLLYDSWNIYEKRLRQLGVHILDNGSITLKYADSKVVITGLSLPADFYDKGSSKELGQDVFKDLIGNKDTEGYQILIAHNPLYFPAYSRWGADLIISGHVHGGLVRLPLIGGILSPQVKLFPKYDAGKYIQGDSCMVVSRGLGSHSFMPRFLNPPELVHIRLINNRKEVL